MVEVKSTKEELEKFLKYHDVSNSYVANEHAFYIMEKELHKWIVGYTDLWVRIYLDESNIVNSYKVKEIHTSL